MVGLAILLLVVGITLLLLEAFIPGIGFFGIGGLAAIIVSAIITVLVVPMGVFIVAGEVLVLGASIFIFFNYIKKKQLYGKLILDESLEYNGNEIGDLDYFVGKEGITKTPLRPFGSVDFNGTPVEVYSEGGFIKEHKSVKVIRIDNQKIVVSEIGVN